MTILDYAVVGLYALGMLAVGRYYARRVRTAKIAAAVTLGACAAVAAGALAVQATRALTDGGGLQQTIRPPAPPAAPRGAAPR